MTPASSTPISERGRYAWGRTVLTLFVCLLLVDTLLWAWHPHQTRLAEQFSPARLTRLVDDAHERPTTLAVFGDSVLWGYKVDARDSATAALERTLDLADARVLNLSYEGGSAPNTYFGLRFMLAHGVRPRAVLFNLNSKEFSAGDSAYNRLHPSLERVVEPLFTAADRSGLAHQPPPDLNGRLDRAMARVWRLYAWRTDLREALFGDADAASALSAATFRFTGAAERAGTAHAPTAERFFATYDLAPIRNDNAGYRYLVRTAELLKQEHIAAVVFSTPTNHTLLHQYIDVPEYDQNLARLRRVFANVPNATVVDLDRAIPSAEFIDNDHLTPAGNRRLATLLAPALRKAGL